MQSSIWRWINERWPLEPLMRLSLEEEMPGGARYAYVFGSSIVLTFLIQAFTGIAQLFYYVPATDHAYNSLNYLRTEIPFGWLIHGLHYWGATAMVLLVGLHMCQVFIWGAYKHPRQLTWLIGVALMITTSAISYTGPTLSWNQQGYWAGEVGTSIAGTIPLVGDLVKRLLRGGAEMGQLTLSRFFILHVAILPAVLVALIAAHVVAFRHCGAAGPWDEDKRQRIGFFWPDQLFKDAVFFAAIFLLLIGLTVYIRAPFHGPADPLDTTYVPKPEWNFLFLYQALKFFHGRLEVIGTVGVPLLLVLLLVLLPFWDRSPERSPRKRPVLMACGAAYVAAVLAFALWGYYSRPPGAPAPAATAMAPLPISPEMPPAAREGARLFQSLPCLSCHRVGGRGGTLGPPLSSAALRAKSRELIITQIRDPRSLNPKTIMPSYPALTDQQISTLVDFLLNLPEAAAPPPLPAPPAARPPGPPSPTPAGLEPSALIGPAGPPGRAAYIVGDAERGAVLFRQSCESCHGLEGTGGIPNPGADGGWVPSLKPVNPLLYHPNPQAFAENIDRYIQHGSMPKGVDPQLHMLPFGDSNTLTQQMISNIEAYLLRLNGVDRAQPVNPGMPPPSFFWISVAVFGGGMAVLGGIWVRRRKRLQRLNSLLKNS